MCGCDGPCTCKDISKGEGVIYIGTPASDNSGSTFWKELRGARINYLEFDEVAEFESKTESYFEWGNLEPMTFELNYELKQPFYRKDNPIIDILFGDFVKPICRITFDLTKVWLPSECLSEPLRQGPTMAEFFDAVTGNRLLPWQLDLLRSSIFQNSGRNYGKR